MSLSSRRTFNIRLGKFLLSAAVPPAVLKQCQAESSNQAEPSNQPVLKTNANKVPTKKVVPEVELFVPTFFSQRPAPILRSRRPQRLEINQQIWAGKRPDFSGKTIANLERRGLDWTANNYQRPRQNLFNYRFFRPLFAQNRYGDQQRSLAL